MIDLAPTWKFTRGNQATADFGVKDEAEFTSSALADCHPECSRNEDLRRKAKEIIETAMRGEVHFFEWT